MSRTDHHAREHDNRAATKVDGSTAQPTSRELQRLRTRRRITAAANDLIAEVGLEDTMMSEIARRANVTRATLYLHFDNKAAIVKQLLRDLPPPFESFKRFDSDGPSRSHLRWVLEEVANWYESQASLLLAAIHACASDKEFEAFFLRMTDRLADRLADEVGFLVPTAETERERHVRMRLLIAQVDWFCTRAILQRAWDGPVAEGLDQLVELWFANVEPRRDEAGDVSPSPDAPARGSR